MAGNGFRTLQTIVDRAVSPRPFVVMLIAGFEAFALILASLGIHAVISYSVSRRTQEIGIRIALGPSRFTCRCGFCWRPGDSLTFNATFGLLTIVAAIAGFLPARRASRIDPVIALRAD